MKKIDKALKLNIVLIFMLILHITTLYAFPLSRNSLRVPIDSTETEKRQTNVLRKLSRGEPSEPIQKLTFKDFLAMTEEGKPVVQYEAITHLKGLRRKNERVLSLEHVVKEGGTPIIEFKYRPVHEISIEDITRSYGLGSSPYALYKLKKGKKIEGFRSRLILVINPKGANKKTQRHANVETAIEALSSFVSRDGSFDGDRLKKEDFRLYADMLRLGIDLTNEEISPNLVGVRVHKIRSKDKRKEQRRNVIALLEGGEEYTIRELSEILGASIRNMQKDLMAIYKFGYPVNLIDGRTGKSFNIEGLTRARQDI